MWRFKSRALLMVLSQMWQWPAGGLGWGGSSASAGSILISGFDLEKRAGGVFVRGG